MANDAKARATDLREARRRAGLTREALAVRLGVSVGWLGSVERFPGLASPELAARLAVALGMDPTALVRAIGAPRGNARRMVY
jgi:transcriptional regulator with XRE-family HTH domain